MIVSFGLMIRSKFTELKIEVSVESKFINSIIRYGLLLLNTGFVSDKVELCEIEVWIWNIYIERLH